MSRVTNSPTLRRRHRKVLSLTKGYKHGRNNLFRQAKQAVLKAGMYSYRDRRVKKRVFRRQWITAINAAARQHGLSYSQFIYQLKTTNNPINRPILSRLAKDHPEEFAAIIEQSK